jgi:hypothetical protein
MLLFALAFAATPATEVCNGVDDDFDGRIDDDATCNGCTRATGTDGSSYLACLTASAGRTAAANTCAGVGYHLADVDSAGELTLVATAMDAVDHWVGLNDLVTEGSYKRSNGANATYLPWGAAEPDGAANPDQDCVVVRQADANVWSIADKLCGFAQARPLCEQECVPVTWFHDEDADGYGVGTAVTSCGPAPANSAPVAGDCNDGNSSIRPNASERCNTVDDDCDGQVNEGFLDLDSDGVLDCRGDCDDLEPTIRPGAIEVCDGVDQDCDGTPDDGLDADGDGFTPCGGDCDDGDPEVWPGAYEPPGGQDADCDGAPSPTRTYADHDGDGYGDPTTVGYSGPNAVEQAGDCADAWPSRHLGAPELCNGVDDDCDGWIDDDGACAPEGCQVRDGGGERWLICDAPLRAAEAWAACGLLGWELASPPDVGAQDGLHQAVGAGNDSSTWIGPVDLGDEGVLTTPDGLPASLVWDVGQPGDDDPGQDCTAAIRRNSAPRSIAVHDRDCSLTYPFACMACDERTWFVDLDGDGRGAGLPVHACQPLAGRVELDGDCDDDDPAVRPGAPESCDAIDNDCDGSVDEGPVFIGPDDDGDGWFDAASGELVAACGPGLATAGDCDDGVQGTYPGAVEVCNALDDDCDGRIDEDGCACDVVHEGAFVHQFCATSRTFAAARNACQVSGYDLAVIQEPAEQTHLALETFARLDDDWWFGLELVNAEWRWIDGSLATYTRWANDQPNNQSGDQFCGDYIAQNWPNGRWNDAACADANPYVCEAPCVERQVFRDADGDGEGDASITRLACGVSLGWALQSTDCDDQDGARAGGFAEACDAVDNDCDGDVDEGVPVLSWFQDGDGDGFGSGAAVVDCAPPEAGWVSAGGDCNDMDGGVNPAALEVCDGADQDCDGVDDDDPQDGVLAYQDGDGDGFGDDAVFAVWCPGDEPADSSTVGGDCDDADALTSPDGQEVCATGDEDCDGPGGR